MSQSKKSNGSQRQENSVLFALRELEELEGARRTREEEERRRREADAKHAREESDRRAAREAHIREAVALAAARARAEAEARAGEELAALRAEVGGAAYARALPSVTPAPRRPVPGLLKAAAASVSVAALAVVGALWLAPRETIILHDTPERVIERKVDVFVPLYTAAPETAAATAASGPETSPTTGKIGKKPHPKTAAPREDCRLSRDPLCGTDVGSAR